jgi:hypothetical protein
MVLFKGYHPPKYNSKSCDWRVESTAAECCPDPTLFIAAYTSSSWKSMMAAVSCFEKFAFEKNLSVKWPIPVINVQMFINWAIMERKLSPNTVKSYIHHLATIHKLKNMSPNSCKNFANEAMIRGAENLAFYEPCQLKQKNVMTLPLLRVLGHELCKSDWSIHSKSVFWAACTCAFFGSFRFGELLSKEETRFNPHETLLWKDVTFLEDLSIKIHNKIPKTRTQGGEIISLFQFPKFSCCPVEALRNLKKLSNSSNDMPVFTFKNGTYLTNKKLNSCLRYFLSKQIGEKAENYSCQSFRGGLPSALAAKPKIGNDGTIKKWGRWMSDAFERYTRLNHIAKRAMFESFVNALDM